AAASAEATDCTPGVVELVGGAAARLDTAATWTVAAGPPLPPLNAKIGTMAIPRHSRRGIAKRGDLRVGGNGDRSPRSTIGRGLGVPEQRAASSGGWAPRRTAEKQQRKVI